ncbi:metallophosphoesterase family protein [Priestia filamentosa]|uniref:metallophosphoesterase family protein n=1 Tax=Priestia filamentosa TaxID=1402861 RepID=UPI00397C8290
MRKFFISDIHGHYEPFIEVLEAAKFKPGVDILIVGGDMIDRGPDSGLVIKKVKQLMDRHPHHTFALMGNHEEMVRYYLEGISHMWSLHGGVEASKSFKEVFKANKTELNEHINWMLNLPLIMEDEDGIYCHAGIDFSTDLDNQSRDVLWMNTNELFALTIDEILDYTGDKKIYRGHNPVTEVKTDMARVCCDLGMGVFPNDLAALALIDITNQEYYRFCAKTSQVTQHRFVLF